VKLFAPAAGAPGLGGLCGVFTAGVLASRFAGCAIATVDIAAAAGADLLVHEVAMARPELMKEAYIQRIVAHHTTPREAGLVFAPAQPKLAVFTHIVQLASGTIAPPSIEELVAETRNTYSGPLEVGEDLMQLQIGNDVEVRRCSVSETTS
jgi:hypothetical protein